MIYLIREIKGLVLFKNHFQKSKLEQVNEISFNSQGTLKTQKVGLSSFS
jgi:hypothetical protein